MAVLEGSWPNVAKEEKYALWWMPGDELFNVYPDKFFSLMLFSTPYPKTRGMNFRVDQYLPWLYSSLGRLFPLMSDNAVIVQNVWFPRTEDGWYDERIFDIHRMYNANGWRMIDPHPWDKVNAPPAGRHDRYDYNEFEFCFAFANNKHYTYNKQRGSYAKRTVAKSKSGNMRRTDVAGSHAGGHSKLHPEGAAKGNIFRYSPTGGQEQFRPRVKGGVFPMALAERVIGQYSNQKDAVLDWCCGSGTTVVAAARLNRYGVGCDTDQDSIMVAKGWCADEAG